MGRGFLPAPPSVLPSLRPVDMTGVTAEVHPVLWPCRAALSRPLSSGNQVGLLCVKSLSCGQLRHRENPRHPTYGTPTPLHDPKSDTPRGP
jgi:hypothetical protein